MLIQNLSRLPVALILLVAFQGTAFCTDEVVVKISNAGDFDVDVVEVVVGEDDLTKTPKGTIKAGQPVQSITVKKGATLRFYKTGVVPQMKVGTSAEGVTDGTEIYFRKPGVLFEVYQATLDDINYSEPGWSIEAMFTMTCTVSTESTKPRSKTYSEYSTDAAGRNKHLEIAKDNAVLNLWQETFLIPEDKLSEANITFGVSGAWEVDTSSANDKMAVHGDASWADSGSRYHTNLKKPYANIITVKEWESETQFTLSYRITPIKTFEIR